MLKNRDKRRLDKNESVNSVLLEAYTVVMDRVKQHKGRNRVETKKRVRWRARDKGDARLREHARADGRAGRSRRGPEPFVRLFIIAPHGRMPVLPWGGPLPPAISSTRANNGVVPGTSRDKRQPLPLRRREPVDQTGPHHSFPALRSRDSCTRGRARWGPTEATQPAADRSTMSLARRHGGLAPARRQWEIEGKARRRQRTESGSEARRCTDCFGNHLT
ncbi:hypothetical protein VFPBJ_03090 [Purpureocillium lilacinum]|uniref:Uncharacterized protein n=1 Tax=Purpureocillium lilacinum TaxID=33203 RepID=A0A179H2Q4_PURLI|nr:hypothetical protein VFPBJ_03090 [Purpureocillium lilacinum]